MKSWEMFGLVLFLFGMLLETVGCVPIILYYLGCWWTKAPAKSPPSWLHHFGTGCVLVGMAIVLFCQIVLR